MNEHEIETTDYADYADSVIPSLVEESVESCSCPPIFPGSSHLIIPWYGVVVNRYFPVEGAAFGFDLGALWRCWRHVSGGRVVGDGSEVESSLEKSY
jgi:hypothetical protein